MFKQIVLVFFFFFTQICHVITASSSVLSSSMPALASLTCAVSEAASVDYTGMCSAAAHQSHCIHAVISQAKHSLVQASQCKDLFNNFVNLKLLEFWTAG